MHLDVQDLRSFYYRTQLGRAAQRSIRDQVRTLWPDARSETVVGFGFAVPLLRPFLPEARRVIALMPGPQGVMAWPQGMPNVSVLCEETLWPIETGVADKILLLHGLETSENPTAVLEEVARCLAPGGRALFVVPNRGGMWARRDATPFGFGRPYTTSQLEAQLRMHDLVPERHAAALFQPPSERRFWLKTGGVWEGLGRRVSAGVAGGVLMVEATKRVPAPRKPGLPESVRRPLRILDPVPQPGASPV